MNFCHFVLTLLCICFCIFSACGNNFLVNYLDYLDQKCKEPNGINIIHELASGAALLKSLEVPFGGFVEKILKTSYNELTPVEQKMMKQMNKVYNFFHSCNAKISSALQNLALKLSTYDYQSAIGDEMALLRSSYDTNVLSADPVQLQKFSISCINYDPYGLLEVMLNRIKSSCTIPTLLNIVIYRRSRNFFIDLEKHFTLDEELTELKNDFLIRIMHSYPSHAEILYYKALGQPSSSIPDLKNRLRKALNDDIPASPLCFLKVVYTAHDGKRSAMDVSLKKLGLDLLQLRELAVACNATKQNRAYMRLVNGKIKEIAEHALKVRQFFLDKIWPDELYAIVEKRVPMVVAKGDYLPITRDLHDIFVNVDDEDFGYHIINTDFLENDVTARYFTCEPDDCIEFYRENLFMLIYRYNKTMVQDQLENSKIWKQKNFKAAQELLRSFNYKNMTKVEDIRHALEEKFGVLSPTFKNICIFHKAVVDRDYAHIQIDYTEQSEEHYVFLFAFQQHGFLEQDHYVTVNIFV